MSSPGITVLGSGFGALSTVRELRARLCTAPITLISPRAELHYLPGSIWIPSGRRRREDLVVPLAPFFERMKVRHVQAEVTGLEDAGRTVLIRGAERIANDALVIATGGRFIRKLPGIEHAITPCEGISAAEEIRERLGAMAGGAIAIGFSGNPKEPAAVRGGPMFEFLFAIDTQLRREGRRGQFTLTFFHPKAEPGKRLGEQAVQGILAEMRRRGIQTHLGHKPLRFEEDKVVTEGGEIPADLILFMSGMTGNAWLDATALPRSPGGLVAADAQCRVRGWPRTYVVGDAGSFPGPDWAPKQAHMADLQARAAAQNLIDALAGRPETAGFKTELLCIIDTLEQGKLVWRTDARTIALPWLRPLHWAKAHFERRYLKRYR
ncbi:NAD(P)/FAD-dependent oxidoreductase [Comamonas flocculans]|uniref:NAD(P)/FAD-dependent oxidoreductase n=1 Tax=Comamonas flocculans TaxID=2597701 RepID=A0A5B8RTV1_9BURK|nr:FAD-dependent oxidoreductase [Comamonas flocculans]QEA12152.1 NAD(P)/FAD-dependent oxidoreductase [Comamonas flocculans]